MSGHDEVDLPASGTGVQQPFGGSGSNRVCDRDKLIRFLRRNPERMREWARVLGVRPTFRAVKKYIAKLHPVTEVLHLTGAPDYQLRVACRDTMELDALLRTLRLRLGVGDTDTTIILRSGPPSA